MWRLEIKLVSGNRILSATDISHAFEIAFEYPVDLLNITLNEKTLSMPLAYVFSDLLYDFLTIINDLLDHQSGSGVYGFSQNNVFDADWHLEWNEKILTIKVIWRMYQGKEMHHSSTTIVLEKQVFLESWKTAFNYLSSIIDFKNIQLKYNDDKEKIIISRLLEV